MNKGKQKHKLNLKNRKNLENAYKDGIKHYAGILSKYVKKIHSILNREKINYSSKHRVKSFESFYDKLIRIQAETPGKNLITDLMGIRIICPFIEDLDLVEACLSEELDVIEIEHKGAAHSFKEFAYESIHMLIQISVTELPTQLPLSDRTIEVQVCTILQDAWAEVEHELIYKADYSILNESLKRKLASLNATLTLADINFQEIRDQQKDILQRGEKRRNSLIEKIENFETISILDSISKPSLRQTVKTRSPVLKPKSQLEKLLFESLNAHSNHEYQKAIDIYSKILRMNPEYQIRSIIYNHRGMAYFLLSQYTKSIKDFSKAFDFDNTNFRALNNRALSHRLLHHFDKALKDFEESLKIHKPQFEGLYGRALTHFDLRNLPSALEDCKEALNIKPDFQPALRLKKIIETMLFT